VIHSKVKWASIAAALSAVLTALASQVGLGYPSWVAGLLAAAAAFLGGYHAPSPADNQDPEAVAS
jgi:hypothetical protein